ncbi:MAG: type I methionyl aminopeptidase [Armatimonadetes bacterium]|nr:type I methionyl aminopeptidase [Armatimonadota bacterium]
MITLKSPSEIDRMREAGRIVAKTIRLCAASIVPGKTTLLEIDALGRSIIEGEGAVPSFLGYRGYPNSICLSVNEMVVHGIPDDRVLQEGDILDIDVGACVDGFHADACWTYPIGEVNAETRRLLNVTRESLFQGLAKAKPGNRVEDISATIQRYAERNGYGIVRELVGHGIGRSVHEEPSVPNYGKPGKGPVLQAGMTICVEPMVNMGTHRIKELADGWTIVTADSKYSAHYEHTILITPSGFDILTKEPDRSENHDLE